MEVTLTWTTIERTKDGSIESRSFDGSHDKHNAWEKAVSLCDDTTVVAIVPGLNQPYSEKPISHFAGVEDALEAVSRKILEENN